MEEDSTTVKVAVLEQKISDLKEIVLKVEEAIEKINQCNVNIAKMLAVHEEKINNNFDMNESLDRKINNISNKMDEDHKNVLTEITSIKTDITKLDGKLTKEMSSIQTKFVFAMGAIVVIGFIINNAGFFSNLLKLGHTKTTHLTNPPSYVKLA